MKTKFKFSLVAFFCIIALVSTSLSPDCNNPGYLYSGNISTGVSGNEFSEQSGITVSTVRVDMINPTWASCQLKVVGSPITEKGACCWITPSPTISQKKFIASGSNSTVQMTGLNPSTKYYVRAYVKTGTTIIYGNELSFTTTATSPKSDPNQGRKVESKQQSSKN